MNIVCFKCNHGMAEVFLEKGTKLILIIDEWDLQNGSISDEVYEKIYVVYKIKSIDSIEELSSVWLDIDHNGIVIDDVLSGAKYGIFAAGFRHYVIELSMVYRQQSVLVISNK